MSHQWKTVVGREVWVTEEATNAYEHELRDEILRFAELVRELEQQPLRLAYQLAQKRIEELEAERSIRDKVAPTARMPAVDALFESGVFSEAEHEQRPPAASD